jgi:hypothetical protein
MLLRGSQNSRPPSHPSIGAGARLYRTRSPSFGSAPMLSASESSLAHDVELQHQREEQQARDEWNRAFSQHQQHREQHQQQHQQQPSPPHTNHHLSEHYPSHHLQAEQVQGPSFSPTSPHQQQQHQQQHPGPDPRSSPAPPTLYHEAPSPFLETLGAPDPEDRASMMLMGTSMDQGMTELLEPSMQGLHHLFSSVQPHHTHSGGNGGDDNASGSGPAAFSPIMGFDPLPAPANPPPSSWNTCSWHEPPAPSPSSSAAAAAAAASAAAAADSAAQENSFMMASFSTMLQPAPQHAGPGRAPTPPLETLRTFGSSPHLGHALSQQQQQQQHQRPQPLQPLGSPLLSMGSSGYTPSPGPGSSASSGAARQPSGPLGQPPHRLMGALSTAFGSGHVPSASGGPRMLRQMVSETSTPREFRLSSVSSASAAGAAAPHSAPPLPAPPGGAPADAAAAAAAALGAGAARGGELDGGAQPSDGRSHLHQSPGRGDAAAGPFASLFAPGPRDPAPPQFAASTAEPSSAPSPPHHHHHHHSPHGGSQPGPSSQAPPPSPPHFHTGFEASGMGAQGYSPPMSPSLLEQLQPDDTTMHEFPGNGSQEQAHPSFAPPASPQSPHPQPAAPPAFLAAGPPSRGGPGPGPTPIASAAPPAPRAATASPSAASAIPIGGSPAYPSLSEHLASEQGPGPSAAAHHSSEATAMRAAVPSSNSFGEVPGSTNRSTTWLGSPASSCYDMLMSPPGACEETNVH